MLATLTGIHVLLSLIGIGAGLMVFQSFLRGRASRLLTNWFLATTFLTSATGFLFPYQGVTPGIVIGLISIAVLALAVWAWRAGNGRTFVVASLVALYLNCFVLVVQSFLKVPPLRDLAPTQTEIPFALSHGAVLVAFVVFGIQAVRRYRGAAALAA